MVRPAVVIIVASASALLCAHGVMGLSVRAQPAPMTAPMPAMVQTDARHAARVEKGADGHFWASAHVDGRTLRLLVDTGASTVALTPADARALGLSPEFLTYDRTVSTAAGQVRAAQVTLARVDVDGARVDQVAALVVEQGLPASLLGMSYLGRLSGFEADRAGLTLRP